MEPQASLVHLEVGHVDDSSLVEADGNGSNFGCSHYKRKCKIKTPCCDEIFDCRHCHNEVNNSLDIDPLHRHDVPRHEVKKVICSLCETEQDVQQNCINCGVTMGKYFCQKCKFFDDDNQYHCDQCGICRTGGQENFFHSDKCGCCYSKVIRDTHVCVERAMHHDCPICYEILFVKASSSSIDPTTVGQMKILLGFMGRIINNLAPNPELSAILKSMNILMPSTSTGNTSTVNQRSSSESDQMQGAV